MPDERDEKQKKKPYEKPKLTAYGDVREITRTVGPMSMPDGGGAAGMNMIKS